MSRPYHGAAWTFCEKCSGSGFQGLHTVQVYGWDLGDESWGLRKVAVAGPKAKL